MDAMLKRWEKISFETRKISLAPKIAKIYPPLPFQDMLNILKNFDGKAILWERSQNPPSLLSKLLKGVKSIAIIVGPEGGFSDDEVKVAGGFGFIDLSLGRRILRANFAPIYTACVTDFLMLR
jgi:16S rRNA (uracil1498-N3)-methyltransferase